MSSSSSFSTNEDDFLDTQKMLETEFSLDAEIDHAREVFQRFDADNSGVISSEELCDFLVSLDIDASKEEADALFKYLDENRDGEIDFSDFLPWYYNAALEAKTVANRFQNLITGRRTVDAFDQTPVSEDVLRRAVKCAIAAPNRSMSEPWRFISVGPETVKQFSELNNKLKKEREQEGDGMETETSGEDGGECSTLDWNTIPGWTVVTTKTSPDDKDKELEDFKSTSCAVQNFMLSMWSEGVGSKWTSGPVQHTQEFADLCGVDTSKERVAGCIWYGFASGGLVNADPKRRKKDVDDVLSSLP
eukprot:CAMPEP_0178965402 /NCGR_PEP_ID=MMETSP0789-20121207/16263_1 /TAXON_ID=3005 /ORGANISM="Rhizosolenia setigera, Strain CCMP 1694" /LENGTH=303 /DNA_ID=CAMNT_0020650385 /DNA_START=19 /DNA_END=930 /DNA_ORIENTATION=+